MRTGATFADAAADWLRYVEHDHDVKPSTLTDYRQVAARLVAEFGRLAIEDISAERIDASHAGRPPIGSGLSPTAPGTSR